MSVYIPSVDLPVSVNKTMQILFINIIGYNSTYYCYYFYKLAFFSGKGNVELVLVFLIFTIISFS